MQFEETWAALLGVLSSPPMVEDTSTDVRLDFKAYPYTVDAR